MQDIEKAIWNVLKEVVDNQKDKEIKALKERLNIAISFIEECSNMRPRVTSSPKSISVIDVDFIFNVADQTLNKIKEGE